MSKNLSKRVVGASVLAAAIGMAAGTSAQTLGTAAYPANTFAIELNYNSAATPAGVAITIGPVTTNLGFGVSSGQNRYIRYILSGGTFKAALANTQLVDQSTSTGGSGFGADTTTAGGGVTVVSGGAIGGSCVVFQVTGEATTGNAQADVIAFTSSTLDVPSNAAPVNITYTLHETATSASCTTGDNSTILNTPASGAVATFSNSIAFTSPTVYTDTADVQFSLPPALPFGGFVQGVAAPSDAQTTLLAGLSNISLAIATYAGLVPVQPTQANGVAPITLPLLASKAVITVSSADGGSFSASALNNGATPPVLNVDLYNLAACNNVPAGVNVGVVNAATTSVTFTNPGPLAPFSEFLCYDVTGKTAVPAGTYQASLTLTPVANVTLESIPSIQAGVINHNGTVLQAPWFTTYSGYISRFFLTNNGTFNAPYTAAFLTESGVTAAAGPGASGTIAPGTTLEIDATSLATLSGGTRATVIFNVAAPNATIQGAYNVVNAATGSITVSPMIRPGTN